MVPLRYIGIDPTVPATSNAQLLTKETNAKLLFNIVAREGSISRAQLAKVSGLSPSTVSVLTEELIRNHMLLEAGTGESAPTGRKPIMLEVDPSGMQIPCFAFRPGGLVYVLYDLKLNVIERFIQEYPSELINHNSTYFTPANEPVLNLFTETIEKSQKLDMSKVRVFTISFYGAFMRDTSVFASGVLGWHLSTSFVDSLREKYNIPFLLSNNAQLLAYAEKSLSNTDHSNLLYVHLDAGVGSGVILDGVPYVGECGISGEIGHMLVGGQRLENLVSTKAIRELLKERHGITSLKTASSALEIGDMAVTNTMREVATNIATGLNNVLCILGSMDVYIGGYAMYALGPVFLDLIRNALQNFGFRRVLMHSPLHFSQLDENGDCFGAAKAFVDNIFTVVIPQ